MGKKSIWTKSGSLFMWSACLENMSVRRQIQFTCGVLMGVMVFSGLMLATVSYETTQDYQATMQTVSDIYALNNALDSWDATMEGYILNSTELERQECEKQWRELGQHLEKFHIGVQESSLLALSNIRSIYRHTGTEMNHMLSANTSAERAGLYAQLYSRKEGMLFLSEQLLKAHIAADVKNLPQIISRNNTALVIFFLILVASFILLIACSMRMTRAICTPIDLLVTDARQIAKGHYDTSAVEILNHDELGYLSQVFNEMKKQVSANFKNMERIIELQNLLQEAELKSLQVQINPHFLFNVLSVAEEAALCENANQTVEIIENISYMLQYSLKCTKQDSILPDELRTVRAYLFLQEKRFGDRIQLTLSLEDNIPPLAIPGMSLQPVVENAIRHGVERLERDGVVRVTVRRRSEDIEVIISDNGCGIEPGLLSAIRRKESIQSPNGTGGIGLVNVCRRMELFYKRTDLFEINSSAGQGTTVILRYPLKESEAPDV